MRLLDYTVIDKLGEGGTGTVYRAQDRRQGRTVALKLTHDRPGGAALTQLEREAHTLRLEHPNILAAERLETLKDGRLLLVMPFFEGRTLEKWLVPVSFARALEVVRQVALGLAYAHAQGVVHCDIKPANLLASSGQIKILDFGLSRLLGDPDSGVRGTLEYMSPEAARGQAQTPSCDLWSLGVIFYELLTGRSPFAATTLSQTLRNIAEAEPSPVTHSRPGLPSDTEGLLARLLSKSPAGRYPDADALLADLGALAEGRSLAPFAAARPVPQTPSVPPVAHALPPKTTVLLGRENELALLSLYLNDPECRLLTLQGLGGVGKTHLSVWLAHVVRPFSHVHFVPLAEVTGEGFIAALTGALGLEETGLEALRQVFVERKQLLVLDTFEHLTAQAPLLEALLTSCPGLVILVTSRARLGLPSEWVVPLQGLSVPSELPDIKTAHAYGALALFAHRAGEVAADFDLARDLPSAHTICTRLQGHPLGITLAAGLLGHKRIEEVAEGLEKSFAELGGGTGRHSSLKTVFEQSCALLSPPQRTLLSALTLFQGGAEAEAVRVVTGADDALLGELLERSLLDRTLEGRYIQHPLIQQFSKELLSAPSAALAPRWRRYYLAELRRLDMALRGKERKKALRALARDTANLRAALRQEPVTPELAEPLRIFYTQQGRYLEGLELFAAKTEPFAQACAGWFALLLGDLERAEESVKRATHDSDERVRLIALNTRAGVQARRNDIEAAKATTLEVLTLAQRQGDAALVSGSLSNLALLEESSGRLNEAVRYYEKSLELAEEVQDHAQLLVSLNNLASLYLDGGEAIKARALLEKGLVLSDQHRLTRMKPLLQINFGFSLYLSGDYANAEAAYLEAHRVLLKREDASSIVIVEAYLGQTYGAQGDAAKAYRWLQGALRRAQKSDDPQGTLCALVRIAELFQPSQEVTQMIASLVYTHAFSEPSDRHLAARLGGDQEPSGKQALSLEPTLKTLLEATTLPEAQTALSRLAQARRKSQPETL